MRDGWREVRLGDALKPIRRKAEINPRLTYKLVTLRVWGKGACLRKRAPGSDLGSAKYVVKSGDLMISKIDARKGSCALLPAELDGAVVTGDFLSYEVDEAILMRKFADLWVRTERFWNLCDEISGGTTNRVRMDPHRFPTLAIPLPPLDEQRRIVDVMSAVDDAIGAAESALLAATRALAALRTPPPTGEFKKLGALAQMRSGPSWKAADEARTPGPNRTPVLGITNTPPGSRLDLTDEKFVSHVPDSAMRLDESCLVLIRTNGNRSRIGNVYRATSAVEGFVVSAFQIAVRPNDPDDSAFLYWFLGADQSQAAMTMNASGSTGLGNIAIGWLKELSVPVLDGAVRAEYESKCEAADRVRVSARSHLDSLHTLRSNLLTVLLSGEHEIPGSYDAVMGLSA